MSQNGTAAPPTAPGGSQWRGRSAGESRGGSAEEKKRANQYAAAVGVARGASVPLTMLGRC